MRVAALAAFATILAGGFEPFYLRVFFADAARMRSAFTELPYRKLTGFRRFLSDVDQRTPPGAHIAIAVPFGQWEGGYGYGYYRASFLLPGKQVVPLLALGADRPAPENLAQADYIAAWHGEPRLAGFATVWRGPDGTLSRRIH